jgi:putative transcriptional regulator
VESVREGGKYLRGEAEPTAAHFVGEPDPREIRMRMGLTQEEFASALRISVKTQRNWEQGRREPSGPAMRLLQLAAKQLPGLGEPTVDPTADPSPGDPSRNFGRREHELVEASKGKDVYLACRDNLQQLEVSLHTSGVWRLAWTSAAIAKRPDLPVEHR